MLFTMVLAGSAAAQKLVPFQGSIHGTDTDSFDGLQPGFVTVNGVGSGIATHLGTFSMTWQLTLNLANPTALVHFTSLPPTGPFTQQSPPRVNPPTRPGVVHITEIHTITGGTGRFTNAKGSFIMDLLADVNAFSVSGHSAEESLPRVQQNDVGVDSSCRSLPALPLAG
jgi:hypothetical protein